MIQHFLYFETDTNLEVLLQQEPWSRHHMTVKKTSGFHPSSILGMIECETEQPLDADGEEDFRDLPDYCTGVFNIGAEEPVEPE